MFEQWSLHASAGKSRSMAALLLRPRVTFYRHLCLHFIFLKIIAAPKFSIHSTLDNRWHSASNKKNCARLGLQTDKFCTFMVMHHNFGSLRRVSWQRRYPKPIDKFPTINLWWPTPCLHSLALVFEQWSIHASASKSHSWAALLRRPRVTFYRHLCLHFIFLKIIAAPKF